LYKQALEIKKQELGVEYPQVTVILDDLVVVLATWRCLSKKDGLVSSIAL
jgi:hypothetical protein